MAMGEELTEARRTILRMAWWIVAVCGAWMVAFTPMQAYSISPLCNPTHTYYADAGNPVTFALGIFAVIASLRVLRHRTVAGSSRLAAVLIRAMPVAFIEWVVLYMHISHRCGTTTTEAWFVGPTRDATVIIAFCGPVLFVLTHVLAWRERRAATCLAVARALH